jgi:hypothetical protein
MMHGQKNIKVVKIGSLSVGRFGTYYTVLMTTLTLLVNTQILCLNKKFKLLRKY